MVAALHFTPSTNGYEEVFIIANRVSEKNHLTLIQKRDDGKRYITGGLLFPATSAVRAVFDRLDRKDQYKLALELKTEPWAKMYADPDKDFIDDSAYPVDHNPTT
jgi:hypothetical protein